MLKLILQKMNRIFIPILLLFVISCDFSTKMGKLSDINTSKPYKPFTYWWWMGNAVDSANIEYNLEMMQKAGIGGVHIIPIYGVKGEEDKFIDYLSPRWNNMVKYTSEKASELGMTVDMTLGTGWCFGGSTVKDRDGVMGAEIEKIKDCKGNITIDLAPKSKFPVDTVLCVLADYGNGKRTDLTMLVSDQKLTLPDTVALSVVYVLRMQGPKKMVKRAAPGAGGPMLNPLSVRSFEEYSAAFQKAFQGNLGKYISAIYHDSYEYSGASWSDSLFDKLDEIHGYKLQKFLPELMDKGKTGLSRRIIADYRQTVADLHSEYLKSVKKWAEENNTTIRNQAHGSPTNWLDTYAIADIPETESFGASIFKIPKLVRDEKYISPGNVPKMDVYKFASSAANLTGKPLVSCETHTWLREHFRVALSQCKPEIDKLFVSGINHIYYHGTAYSPKEAAWPGWLFYASTNFAPSNSQYSHFSVQNKYVENCQKILQTTKPDNEIVVYYPFQDILHNFGVQRDILLTINVHNEEEWLEDSEFEKILKELKHNGFGYDYISDIQLMNSKMDGKGIKTTGNEYKAIIVPKCEYMPAKTLQKLAELAKKGANIVFTEALPGTYSGYSQPKKSRAYFEEIKQKLNSSLQPNLKIIDIGLLPVQLNTWKVKQESLALYNLDFIRKKDGKDYVYFISNLNSGEEINEYIPVGTESKDYVFYNPLTEKEGRAKVKRAGKNVSVLIQMKPGQSLFLFAKTSKDDILNWKYSACKKNSFAISGEWDLKFLKGGPVLPRHATMRELTSWTNLPDTMAQYFSGIARYSIDFELNDFVENNKYVITFDEVKESVHIRLNGKDVITLFSFPFEADVSKYLKDGRNHLELEVANLPANRIRYLDKQKVNWQKFYDINFVNINYKAFDASIWEPVESGIVGDISIVCYETETEQE